MPAKDMSAYMRTRRARLIAEHRCVRCTSPLPDDCALKACGECRRREAEAKAA